MRIARNTVFFKVKIDAQFAGQSSTLEEFYQQFGLTGQKAIRKSVLLSNVNDRNLFGVQSVLPTAVEKDAFMAKCFNPDSFHDTNVFSNCCMKILKEEGNEAFLKHFYARVTSKSKIKRNNFHGDIKAIQKRAAVKKAAYAKRQAYSNCITMESKRRCLELSILNEKITESSQTVEDACSCEICDVNYCPNLEVNSEKCSSQTSCDLLYSAGIEEGPNNYLYLTKNFAMAHLCFKNMLADLDSMYSGISYPFLYWGGYHSVFPIHVEDMSCWSFNFLLHGSSKFWIIVPPTSVSQLTDALHRRGFYFYHRGCRNNLGHKFYVPTVDFFKEENIPFELVIQEKGEGIVVLPNAAHTGGNLGPNVAEACNFGTPKWIPYGCATLNCPCMGDSVHAELSDLVAVHAPNLLKAFLSNNIRNVVEDKYFQRSLVVRGKDPKANVVEVKTDLRKKTKTPVNLATRIKCPVCHVSWSYVQRSNMMTHLNKYHSPRIQEDAVTKFVQMYSLSKK